MGTGGAEPAGDGVAIVGGVLHLELDPVGPARDACLEFKLDLAVHTFEAGVFGVELAVLARVRARTVSGTQCR
jgi:hypothetical protein